MPNQFEFRDIPQWFVSIFALTYLTGFLIENFYYSSIGINDLGEIVKLRYIQIGFVFVMLFLIVTVPIFFLLFGRRKMEILGTNPNELPPMKPIMALNAVLYFGTLYYVVTFVPPGYFYVVEHPYRLASFFILMFSVVFGYIAFTGFLTRRRRKITNNKALSSEQREAALSHVKASNQKSQNTFLYIIFIYIVISDFLIFQELIPTLLHALFPYGIFSFCFASCSPPSFSAL